MKYSLFVVLVVSVLLVSCGPSKNNAGLTDPFIGGTKGLAMSFMANAPPAEIRDGGQQPFSVILQVQNLGESAVGPGAPNTGMTDKSRNTFAKIQIVGINPTQFNTPLLEKKFSDSDVDITLPGARRNYDGTVLASAPNIVQFDGFNYMPSERGNTQVTMRANLCYDYTTYSRTQVCIKDNVLEAAQDNTICTLAGAKEAKNSGAPVHVTTFTEAPLGQDRARQQGKIQVTFTVENVGTGQIFRPSWESVSNTFNTDPCDTSLTNPNKNVVHVKVYQGDGSTAYIQCPLLNNGPEGDIQLFQGSSVIMTCTILTDLNQNRVYTDSLYVDLEYTYLEYIEMPVLIRDVTVGATQ